MLIPITINTTQEYELSVISKKDARQINVANLILYKCIIER